MRFTQIPRKLAGAMRRKVKAVAKTCLTGELEHHDWIARRLAARASFYPHKNVPGLFSVLTTAWNTPVKYLHAMAESLFAQQASQEFEWILLDNGSTAPDVRTYLQQLAQRSCVKFFRVQDNLGILNGMRYCIERATGRYIVPVDSDDYLYPDALAIFGWHITHNSFPKALFSDEELLQNDKPWCPSFKPMWDPVLFVDSCYIAHLCAFEREKALALGVYSSADATGCHDWDTYFRFWLSGETPLHVPEILYSWRMHEGSAAQNMDSKSYILDSHRAVLQRYIDSLPHPEHFSLAPAQLASIFNHVPTWWIRRRRVDGPPMTVVVVKDSLRELAPVLPADAYPNVSIVTTSVKDGLTGLADVLSKLDCTVGAVAIVSDRLLIENYDWAWDAVGMMERYGDTAMVGGLIYGYHGKVLEGAIHFGFNGAFGCPDRDAVFAHPGYWGKQWACHSASCVSSMFTIYDARFLAEAMRERDWAYDSYFLLAPHIAVKAMRAGRRVVFCPTIRAKSHVAWHDYISPDDQAGFMRMHPDCFPDRRYYPPSLSLKYAFKACPPQTQFNVDGNGHPPS